MRVSIIRVIAIALGIVLVDIRIGAYEVLPDIVGLTLLFFCAVYFTDRAGRFARTAVVSAVMIFLEVVRLFSMVEAGSAIAVLLGFLYAFLQVILVITAADGIAQFSQFQGLQDISRICDIAGHVYALTFIFKMLGLWLPDLAMVLLLAHYLITIFVVSMFLYFYLAVHTPIDEADLPFAGLVMPEGMEELLESMDDGGIEPMEPL